jgi:hypothetical protein
MTTKNNIMTPEHPRWLQFCTRMRQLCTLGGWPKSNEAVIEDVTKDGPNLAGLEDSQRKSVTSLGHIILGAAALHSHFKGLMRGWPRTHRYRRGFRCGGEAWLEFKQFRRAALMTVGWRRPCCCMTWQERQECERELSAWLEDAEAREAGAKHFRFRQEGSLTFQLLTQARECAAAVAFRQIFKLMAWPVETGVLVLDAFDGARFASLGPFRDLIGGQRFEQLGP